MKEKTVYVLDAEVIEDTADAVAAETMSSKQDAFSAGERLADELEAASRKVAPFAGKAADKGVEIAGKVRVAAEVARELSGHYDGMKAAVGEMVDAVEKRGIPVRQKAQKIAEQVWTISPGPFSTRG